MSYCENCGRQILDESLGCPVCNVRNNIDPSKTMIGGQAEEIKAETVDSFTVEDSDGTSHHFESSTETGEAEYKKKATPASEAKIHPVLKVLIIVAIVMVGGLGAIAGCVAGVVLMKNAAEDYRSFGKTILTVSIVMLAFNLVCCVMSGVTNMIAAPFYY